MKHLALMLAICLASTAQQLPKGREVLGRVAKTYKTVGGFSLEAAVATQMSTETGALMNPSPTKDTIAIDYRAPDYFAVEHGNPRVTTVLPLPPVDQYHPDFNQSVDYDGTFPEGGTPGRPPFLKQRASSLASLGFADYTAIEEALTRAETVRQEPLDLEGSAFACWVVDASYSDHTRRTFWVDMARDIVLREVRRSQEVFMGATGQIKNMEVERTMTVQQLRWNETGQPALNSTATDPLPRPGRNGVTPALPLVLHGASGIPEHPQCYEPAYTDEARIAGLAGVIMMDFTIDEQGRPANIRSENSLGLGLDEMAAACLSRWRYTPAQKDGHPIAVKSKATMNFNQRPRSDWRLDRVAFHAAGGVTRPVFLKAAYPQPDSDLFARVPLHLIIDENGVPRDPEPGKTADPKLAKQAMAIVSRWRFTPGQEDGRPVAVEADFELVHGANSIRLSGPPR